MEAINCKDIIKEQIQRLMKLQESKENAIDMIPISMEIRHLIELLDRIQ